MVNDELSMVNGPFAKLALLVQIFGYQMIQH